jgi:hypothetical protein
MPELNDYLHQHSQCLPRESSDPAAVDVVHFKVIAKDKADPQTLRALVAAHVGEFGEVNVFDGAEHGYIELGGWLGSQQDALMLIGLGTQLGLWTLLSPKTVLGDVVDSEMEQMLAGQGLISIQARAAQAPSDVETENRSA